MHVTCVPFRLGLYYARPIGNITLKGMLKSMCQQAGIPCDNKSNHSLRVTSATRMLNAGLSEKVIMDRTRHHSLDGPKPYARVTDAQQQLVSSIMTHEIQPNTSVPQEVGNKSVLQEVRPCLFQCN